jgi:phage terminase large subunit-like protein
MVTSNYRSLEGKRSTFVCLNETHHHIKGNGGIAMYETVINNATKMDGRFISLTNAFLPGEDSVAERQRNDFERVRTGQAVDNGVLYDSIEAHPDTPMTPEALEIVIPKIRGDATWLNVKAIIKNIQTGSIAVARSMRFWLNMVVAGEDNLHQPGTWRSMARPGERLKKNDEIVLGFDGGKSDDATALVALRVKDMFVQPLGIWQKPDSYIDPDVKWQVDRRAVNNAVHEAFRDYKVRGFYADVNLWESYLADWQEAYGDTVSVKASPHKPFEWDMRGGHSPGGSKKVVEAHEALLTTMQDKKLRHPGDSTPLGAVLQSHVLNAKRRDTVHGVSFGKDTGSQSAKIDAYAALLLAHTCYRDLKLRGDTPDDNEGSAVWFL